MKFATLTASHIRPIVALASLALAVTSVAGPGDPIIPTPFADFTRAREAGYLTYTNTTINNVATDSTGTWLDATFNGKWSNVARMFSTPVDYSAYNGVTLALRNYENRRVRMNIRFDNTPNNLSSGAYSMYVWLPANETIMVLFENGAEDPVTKGMVAAPPVGTSDLPLVRVNVPAFVLKTIYKVQVFNGDTAPQRVAISRLGGVKYTQNWSSLVDTYGQLNGRTWTGKVNQDTDLTNAIASEDADLAQNPPSANLPGVVDSTQTATGKWGVYKSAAGNWFFRTPEGKKFWSIGLHGAKNAEPTKVLNREFMFNLPSILSPAGLFLQVDPSTGILQFDYLRANLLRKYGLDWANQWSGRMVNRVKSWGFNTVGAGSDPGIARTGLPHIEMLSTAAYRYQIPTKFQPIADPFADDFYTSLVSIWKAAYPEVNVRTDPTLMGLYVDNEAYWGYTGGSFWEMYALPAKVISCPITQPSKAFFVSELKTRYTTVAKVNSIYGTAFATWDDVGAPWDVTKSDSNNWYVARDMSSLLRNFSGTYAWRVRDAIRAVFPKALYLGGRCQPWSTPREVYESSDPNVDVHSMNIYGDDRTIDWNGLLAGLTKPVMISEFGFTAQNQGYSDSTAANDASTTSSSVAQTADRLGRYLNHAMSIPNIIGIQYYKAVDQPLTGRPDTENTSLGMLDITDRAKPELVSIFRNLIGKIYSTRL